MAEPMTLVERLHNPAWELAPKVLNVERTLADMDAAAARIDRLENAINRYLASSYSCNGGAERLFELALGHEPMPDFT